ncbi:MAG: shikimate dehydrogenase [Syntrophales bacterium]|jgi:shikimate dehydrogenase|nr:shikimate dehydrogenase [Syntrophales bacterium]
MKRKDQEKHFALFGNPVGHSLSPRMHRTAYEEMRISARYEAYRVENAGEIIPMMKSLGIDGASVTLPFKEAIIGDLDEITASARTIGAVNTIINREGMLIGDNTDWIGLVRDLKDYMQIKGKTFAVLGAGGMARAAVFGLLQEGGIPVIFNRTRERGAALARAFNSLSLPLDALDDFRAEALIQTTPVGMAPDTDRSPLKREILTNFRYVMDAIYNPLTTKLLRDAQEMDCLTINGVGLFIHQGAEQIRIWTGREPSLATMRQTVLAALQGGQPEDGRLS